MTPLSLFVLLFALAGAAAPERRAPSSLRAEAAGTARAAFDGKAAIVPCGGGLCAQDASAAATPAADAPTACTFRAGCGSCISFCGGYNLTHFCCYGYMCCCYSGPGMCGIGCPANNC